jgi:excinuclease UvrABC nuclease subunit
MQALLLDRRQASDMMNCTLKITWSDKIEFLSNNAKSIPSYAGVYEIQGRKKTDGGYTRRYVGTSQNLRDTYSRHLSNVESNDKLKQFLKDKKSFFRYVKVSDELLRKDLERGLYHKYRHSFVKNENTPGSGKYSKISVEENNT